MRNHLIQARLNDEELASFNQAIKLIKAKDNSTAIRIMIEDICLLNEALSLRSDKKKYELFIKTLNQLDRDYLTRAFMGITADSTEMLRKIKDQYDTIQAQLNSLLWLSNNMTNNVNQIAHAVNRACAADPANLDAWKWVMNNLQLILNDAKQIKEYTLAKRHSLKEPNKDASGGN